MTERNTTNLSFILLILAILFILATLLSDHFYIRNSSENDFESPTGYIAFIGASFIFGTTGIPMKSKVLKTLKVDSFIFALYTGIGIFIVNLPVVLYLVINGKFLFKPYAVIGSIIIILIGYLAFQAVQKLGYSKAPAIWAGVGIVTAFLYGLLLFDEKSNNIELSMLGILILVIGVYFVSSSQTKMDEISDNKYIKAQNDIENDNLNDINVNDNDNNNNNDIKIEDKIIELIVVSNTKENEIDSTKNEMKEIKSNYSYVETLNIFSGYLLCFANGICDGSLLVPYKLGEHDERSLNDMLNYLASFGLSSIIISPLLFILYLIITRKQITLIEMKVTFFPGLLSGMLWACANFMSVISTSYLGLKIGFPLTQTCVLFAAGWGVFYFNEINVSIGINLFYFICGIIFIILGALLLGISK